MKEYTNSLELITLSLKSKEMGVKKKKSEGILWLQRSIADRQDVGKLLLKKITIFT